MVIVILMLCLSTLLVVLGFAALLKQKVYLDSQTKQPTSVEVPLLGKMKTNYPALVFVFLGAALAVVTFTKFWPPAQKQWIIQGSFSNPRGQTHVSWKQGTLYCMPTDFKPDIKDSGNFTITAMIADGKTFEDIVQVIDYTNDQYHAQIVTKKEYDAYRKDPGQSLIQSMTANTRMYKAVPVESY